jgi:transcriptional regulator with XRE-family HTH domain
MGAMLKPICAEARRFGDNLKRLIALRGTSTQAIAEKAGLCQRSVQSYVSGARSPTWAAAIKLAVALGVSTEEFRQEVYDSWQNVI